MKDDFKTTKKDELKGKITLLEETAFRVPGELKLESCCFKSDRKIEVQIGK